MDSFQNPFRMRTDLNTLTYTLTTLDLSNYIID